MTPKGFVRKLLGEAVGDGLKLRELGFRPLTAEEQQVFQGADPEYAVILDLEGNFELVYDIHDERLEIIGPDSDNFFMGDLDPETLIELVDAISGLEEKTEDTLMSILQDYADSRWAGEL